MVKGRKTPCGVVCQGILINLVYNYDVAHFFCVINRTCGAATAGYHHPMIASPHILSERRGCLGVLTLNRPQALNALTLDMVVALRGALSEWERDDGVRAVVLKGEGRAFCAGGDIRAIWDAASWDDDNPARAFYGTEYQLDLAINRYPKPFISLLNGIVMGGGAGLSMLGRYRVATANALFAMPETAIGFFPDVGGGWLLPRLPGRLGLYLGLTGTRLGAADMAYAGLATHVTQADRLAGLETALADGGDVEAVLADFQQPSGTAALAERRDGIDRIFAAASVADIQAALAAETAPWCVEARQALDAMSPTSLLITSEQLRRGAALNLAADLEMEFRLAVRVCMGQNFREGVRAMLVDKDKSPRWSPARLQDVDPAAIAALFEPLGDGRDLVL